MAILFGVLLALIVVATFFGVRVLTSRMSRNLDPISTMAVALASYFAKLLFLGVGLYLVAKFTDPDSVDRRAFGVTALVAAIAWLARDIRSYLKLKLHLPLPQISTTETARHQVDEERASE